MATNLAYFVNHMVLESEAPVLSVSDLSALIKRRVEADFSKVRVRGEISGLKRHSSGHSYFSLKEPGKEAVLNAICWRGTNTGIALQEGLEIIATGRITTYPGRSNYQLIVTQVEVAGEGALLKLMQERRVKWAAEGLFDNHRPLPLYPRVIGVVTSPTGAVIRDIFHRVEDRWPCRVVVYPVAVQGTVAADQVASAVQDFNQVQGEERPDVIIVARGGGSIEDLWAFNEESVVRAVFGSQIPVISAVGHETDTTLCDYAADVRAPTPTAAAEIATPERHQLEERVLTWGEFLIRAMQNHMRRAQEKISSLRDLASSLDKKIDSFLRLAKWLQLTEQNHQNEMTFTERRLGSMKDVMHQRLRDEFRICAHNLKEGLARMELTGRQVLSTNSLEKMAPAELLRSFEQYNLPLQLKRGYSVVLSKC